MNRCVRCTGICAWRCPALDLDIVEPVALCHDWDTVSCPRKGQARALRACCLLARHQLRRSTFLVATHSLRLLLGERLRVTDKHFSHPRNNFRGPRETKNREQRRRCEGEYLAPSLADREARYAGRNGGIQSQSGASTANIYFVQTLNKC